MGDSRADRLRELGSAVFVMLAVWLALLSGQWFLPSFGAEVAVLVAFVAATAIVLASRRRRGGIVDVIAVPAGVLIGFVSFGAWLYFIWRLGSALELPTSSTGQPPVQTVSLTLVSTLVLAPLFEELLYRERLLLALKPLVGSSFGVIISAICFALPHLREWSVLGTFCVGLFLGGVMLRTRSVALCIGIHAGLNLAAALCGIPAQRWVLHWGVSLAVTLALLFAVSRVLRRRAVAEGRL